MISLAWIASLSNHSKRSFGTTLIIRNYHIRNKQNNVINGALYYYQERKNDNVNSVITYTHICNGPKNLPFSTADLREHRPVFPVAPNITTRFISPIDNALSHSLTRDYISISLDRKWRIIFANLGGGRYVYGVTGERINCSVIAMIKHSSICWQLTYVLSYIIDIIYHSLIQDVIYMHHLLIHKVLSDLIICII